jgi:hypothetical protein
VNQYIVAITVQVTVLAMNDKVAAEEAFKSGKDLVKHPRAAITNARVVRKVD